MNDIEVWKSYPEFEFIQGSSLGGVRTLDRCVTRKNGRKQFIKGRILKQRRQKSGYMYVNFSVNGKQVNLRVHRIIAACFLPNPNNLPQVNHIDCDRTNNRVENLEWCSREYNSAYRNKFGVSYKEAAPKSPVIAVNLKTLEALQFPSQKEAARQLGASVGTINEVIKGKRNKHHGYWFTNADSQAVESVIEKFGNSVASKVEKLLNKED